jgi:gas vesicle protein
VEYTEISKWHTVVPSLEGAYMDDDRRFSYFLLGLGLGTALGVLFAPKSGEETRELIKSKADEGKELLRRRSEELKGSATEWVDKSKQAVARQKDQLSAAVEAGRQAYRESVTASGPAGPGPDDVIEGV